MEPTPQNDDLVKFFFALGSEPRQKIIAILQASPGLLLGEITQKMPLNLITVHHHVNILRREKIITARKERQFLRYYFNSKVVQQQLQRYGRKV